MVDISVIIPFYNAETYIENCAVSLFSQTLHSIEFIFVNDGSTDHSESVLKKTFEKYTHVNKTLKTLSKNAGVAAARDTGVIIAQGEYIAFCDADDWVEPEMYEKMLFQARKEQADIVCCSYIEHKDGKSTPTQFEHSQDNQQLIFSFQHFGGLYGALWNKLIRKEFYLQHNCNLGKGLSMWEDSCLLIPLRLKSSKTIFLPDCYYHYNVNSGSISARFSSQKVMDSIEAIRRLEQYFHSEGYRHETQDMVHNLKIASKEVLLRYPTLENVTLFKGTFPESNRYIWNYPNWNLMLKLRAWLVAVLPVSLALWILKHMRK